MTNIGGLFTGGLRESLKLMQRKVDDQKLLVGIFGLLTGFFVLLTGSMIYDRYNQKKMYKRLQTQATLNKAKSIHLMPDSRVSDQDIICIICMTNTANLICIPCNHLQYCTDCF